MRATELRRTALLERLERARPSLVGLAAPAGFGKSTLLRQYVAGRSARFCDCADLRGDLDLARRIFPEADERLGDGAASVADRLDRALALWSRVDGLVVLENAQHVERSPEARRFLTRLLAARPREVTVAIATREARPHLTRFVAPHELVVLRANELAFTAAEIAALFATDGADARTLARIETVSQGWPAAVFLIKRLVTERGVAAIADDLKAVTFESLRDYVADEVIAGLPPRTAQALFACASIPHATAVEVGEALDDPSMEQLLAEFAKDSPFVRRDETGALTLHPMLTAALIEHQDDRRNRLLHDAARAREASGDYERSAALHAARGDQHAAARLLAKHELLADRRPSASYRATLAALDRAIVGRYARLWATSAIDRLLRIDARTLVDEAEALWRTLPPDTSPMERLPIALLRVPLLASAGALVDAAEQLQTFASEADAHDPPESLLDAYVAWARADVSAAKGALVASEAALNRALPWVAENDIGAANIYRVLGADIARVRGEYALEVQFLDRALERSQAANMPAIAAFVQMEMLFGAWLVGDRARVATAAAALEAIDAEHGLPALSFLLDCVRGRRSEPRDIDFPRSVLYGRLMSLGTTRDGAERMRIAESTVSLAIRLGRPFSIALAAVALAYTNELRFGECCTVAQDAAQQCESDALRYAVKAILERRTDLGMLRAFVAAIERGRSDAPVPLAVDVVAGRVRVDGVVIALSGRELELLSALAMRRDAVPRARLAASLWPDLDEPAARNALSVCLHRLRSHLPRRDAIVRDGDGYRLHDAATVDVWEIERVADLLRAGKALREGDRAAVERAWSHLCEPQSASIDAWEWFEPALRRIRAVRIEAAHRLAADALARADHEGALRFALDAVAQDPCDEDACEIVVRAHLSSGDKAAARREFRRYRDAVERDLAAQPSERLAALVSG